MTAALRRRMCGVQDLWGSFRGIFLAAGGTKMPSLTAKGADSVQTFFFFPFLVYAPV